MLLLIDERRRPPGGRPDHLRLPWRVAPSLGTAVGLGVVASTVSGATGAFAAIGALIAAFRALDRALPYKSGLNEHRQ